MPSMFSCCGHGSVCGVARCGSLEFDPPSAVVPLWNSLAKASAEFTEGGGPVAAAAATAGTKRRNEVVPVLDARMRHVPTPARCRTTGESASPGSLLASCAHQAVLPWPPSTKSFQACAPDAPGQRDAKADRAAKRKLQREKHRPPALDMLPNDDASAAELLKRRQAAQRDDRIVREFLAAGRFRGVNDLRTRWGKSYLPLHSAVEQNNEEVVRCLISQRADTTRRVGGLTPYELACKTAMQNNTGTRDNGVMRLLRDQPRGHGVSARGSLDAIFGCVGRNA